MSIEYFMDELQDYEVNSILECIPYLERNEWERSRYSIYSNVQLNISKKIKPTDIMKFEWDKDIITEDTSISNSDIERLKRKAELIQKEYGKHT